MTFQEHERKRFKFHVDSLARLVQLQAPDNLLALAVANLIESAEGAFGEDLYRELLRKRTENLRDKSGFCQHCDNRINPALTHPPVCEQCDARLDEMADNMEKETDNENLDK